MVVTAWSTPLLTWEDTASLNRRSCPTLIPPYAKSLSGGISLLLVSRVPFIKSLSHASRWNTAANLLRSVGSGCMPVQRWACLTHKLPWRNSCVVHLEFSSTKELLLRSLTIYTEEPTHQRSYCTTGNECSGPSPSAISNPPLLKLSSTPNLLWCWAVFETLHPPGLPESNCNPSVLQQTRNCWSCKVHCCCVQSPGSSYTPVLRLIITTRHCCRRSPVSQGNWIVWWSTHVLSPCSVCPLRKPLHLPPPPRWWIVDHHRPCCQNSRNWCYPVRNP